MNTEEAMRQYNEDAALYRERARRIAALSDTMTAEETRYYGEWLAGERETLRRRLDALQQIREAQQEGR